jgi:hypothetical protein
VLAGIPRTASSLRAGLSWAILVSSLRDDDLMLRAFPGLRPCFARACPGLFSCRPYGTRSNVGGHSQDCAVASRGLVLGYFRVVPTGRGLMLAGVHRTASLLRGLVLGYFRVVPTGRRFNVGGHSQDCVLASRGLVLGYFRVVPTGRRKAAAGPSTPSVRGRGLRSLGRTILVD